MVAEDTRLKTSCISPQKEGASDNLLFKDNETQGAGLDPMYSLWLLILCNLTRLRDVQMAGKMLFLGVSLRIFPEDIRFWVKK